MAKAKNAIPPNVTLNNFIGKCRRGIAVFTRGLNLNLAQLNLGILVSAAWPANSKRIDVGDCFVVYHRTGPGLHYPATIYVGRITAITPVGNRLYSYSVDNLVATPIQGVNWVQFSGSQSRIRYF